MNLDLHPGDILTIDPQKKTLEISRPEEHQSVLIAIRPEGSEDRYCGICGEQYLLPIPYEKCSPKSRDLCGDCIHTLQKEAVKS